MKKIFSALICVCLLLASVAGLASENLYGAALFENDRIYYSGSVDGTEVGVFSMDMAGNDVAHLYGAEALLLAEWQGILFLEDYNNTRLVAVSESGEVLMQRDGYYDKAAQDDDALYLNNLKITKNGEKLEPEVYLPLDSGDEWQIKPIEIEDGFLYYYDNQAYAETSAMEGGGIAALVSRNLKTGETSELSAPGTALIAIDDGFAYYTRQKFYVYDQDFESQPVETDEGLFKLDLNTKVEKKIASLDVPSELFSLQYKLEEDGVIYGILADFSGATMQPSAKLLRVRTDGEVLPETEIPYGTLCEVEDGKILLCSYNANYSETPTTQGDRIILIDVETLRQTVLNEDGTLVLFLYEADPELAIKDGRVYGFSYDEKLGAMSLFSMKTDGTDLQTLARGRS